MSKDKATRREQELGRRALQAQTRAERRELEARQSHLKKDTKPSDHSGGSGFFGWLFGKG